MQSHPKTQLLYLEQPDILSAHGQVMAIEKFDFGETGLVIDRSPFFAGGGGQPADQGIIEWPLGRLHVSKVIPNAGRIVHVGKVEGEHPAVRQEIVAQVSAPVRQLHSRIHSAGELICAAVKQLGFHWPVTGAKHYPGDSRVLFRVTLNQDERDKLKLQLSGALHDLIAENNAVKVSTTFDMDFVEKVCGYRPTYLPDREPVRLVVVHPPSGRPCMGTHVARLGEIGTVVINSIKAKKGELAISYSVE